MKCLVALAVFAELRLYPSRQSMVRCYRNTAVAGNISNTIFVVNGVNVFAFVEFSNEEEAFVAVKGEQVNFVERL